MKRILLILFTLTVLAFIQGPGFPHSVVDGPPIVRAAPTASGALSPSPPNNDFSDGLSSWTTSGTTQWAASGSFGASDADLGDYEDSNNTCAGGEAIATSSPSVDLTGSASITSEPFTLASGPVTLRIRAEGIGPAASVSLLHGTNYGETEVVYNKQFPVDEQGGTYDVFTGCTIPSGLLGEDVKIRISSSSGGSISVAFGVGILNTGNDRFMFEAGDPVDIASGTLAYQHTDIAVPGKGIPITFTRYYSSAEQSLDPGRLGHRWSHGYESNVVVLTSGSVLVRYPGGATVFFEEDTGSYTPPVGIYDTLVKNVDDTFTLTTPSQLVYDFDSAGVLTSITDRNDNSTTLTYTSGDLTKVTDAAGRELTFTYDASDRITKITGPLGREVEYAYDAQGDLTSVTDVRDGVAEFTYSEHRLLTIEDSLNNVVATNIYDDANRIVEQEDGEDGVACFYFGHGPSYSSSNCGGVTPAPSAGMTVYVDPEGNEKTYYFDTSFRTTDVVDDLGGLTSYTYETSSTDCNDATSTTDLGNLCTITDPLTHETKFTYDDATGNRLTVENALTKTWTYTYNSFNDVLTETDPLTNVTTYAYDADGNLTSVTNDLSEVTTFTPNSDGTLASITDDLTHKTSYTYDTNGNPASVTNAEGETTTFSYDDGGRMLWEEDPLGNRTTYTYDNQNNVLTITDPLGKVITYTYDAKGQRTKVTDANAFETAFVYDKMGRLFNVTDELDQVVSYGYDENGNRVSMTNPRREAVGTPESGADCGTKGTGDGDDDDSDTVVDDGCPSVIYTIDELGRVEKVADALGNETTYVYDAAGRLTSRNDNNGDATTYTYFDNDQLKKIDYPVGTTDVSFTYDDAGNRKTMIDDTGTTTYTYNDVYRPTSINDGENNTVGYDYDDAGRLTTLTYPGGTDEVTYTYDDANRLTGVTDWLSNATTYDYDPAGRLAATAYPTGVMTSYDFDDAGRLLALQNSTSAGGFSASRYLVDPTGMRTRVVSQSEIGYRESVLNDGPVGYWRLGEDTGTAASDETANANDGTYTNGVLLDQTGAITGDTDTSADFDGVNDLVSVAGSSSLNDLDELTIEAWVYLDGYGESNAGRILARSGGNQIIVSDSSGGFVQFEALRWATDGKWKSPVGSIELGRWHHIVVTYDYGSTSNRPTIYIDGKEVAESQSQAPSGSKGSDTNTIYIGNDSSSATRTFDGRIDEVAYYDYVLPVAAIAHHHEVGKGTYRSAVLEDAPVGYWRLGEGSGTSAEDETGNGNDGTYANSPALGQAGGLTGDRDAAVGFDGVNDSISVSGSSSIDGLQTLSAEGWFYLDGWGENDLGRFFARSGGNQVFFADSCDCFQFEALRWSTDGKWRTPTDSIELGRWYQVAVTYDYDDTANDPVLYIDGQSVAVTEVQAPTGTLTGPDTDTLYIGNAAGATRTFDGRIDEIAYFDYVLTAADVADHYYEGSRTYRARVLKDAPVGYWRLGETTGTTASDETANANDGTHTNGVSLNQGGAIAGDPDRSVYFDADDDLISVPGSASLDGLETISAEGWFYLDGWGEAGLGRFFNRSGGNALMFADSCDCFQFEALRWSTDGKWKVPTDTIELGRWYHVAVVYDYGSTSNDPSMYVNGQAVTVTEVQAPAGTLTGPDTATLYLGNDATAIRTFDGKIDDIAYYDSLLTEATVREHYQHGALTRSSSRILADGPVGYWRLGEQTGSVAIDQSANGNDGTYTNSPTLDQIGSIAGDSDRATDFDGVDDYVSVPGSSTLNDPDLLTIEGWVYLDGWGENSLGRLLARADGYQIMFSSGSGGYFEFQALGWPTIGRWKSPNSSIELNRWYYIAVTYDYGSTSNDPKLYIDGEEVSIIEAQAPSGTRESDTNTIYIGNNSSSATRTFDGRIDEVAIYDYILSPAAIASHFGGDTSTYDYDGAYQVTEVIYPDGDKETFTYDAMGNRLTRVFNGTSTSYTYDAGDRMTAAGGATYTYDANGNLTDRGTADDFGWDHENHLTSTTINSVSSTYDYNGDGLRMSRTIGAATVDYVWDLAAPLPVILEDDDGVRYVYGLDLIALIDGGSEAYYLADGLGSTTALTDDAGAVTDTYEYDVFGNIRSETGSSANEFTYTGEQVDSTDLQYLRARYYDPAIGRFLSEDPLPLLQRYPYVGNNSTNLVDRDGKRPTPPHNATGCGGAPGLRTNDPLRLCPDGPLPPWQRSYEGGGWGWIGDLAGFIGNAADAAWDSCEYWAWLNATTIVGAPVAAGCYWDEAVDAVAWMMEHPECSGALLQAGAAGLLTLYLASEGEPSALIAWGTTVELAADAVAVCVSLANP